MILQVGALIIGIVCGGFLIMTMISPDPVRITKAPIISLF